MFNQYLIKTNFSIYSKAGYHKLYKFNFLSQNFPFQTFRKTDFHSLW